MNYNLLKQSRQIYKYKKRTENLSQTITHDQNSELYRTKEGFTPEKKNFNTLFQGSNKFSKTYHPKSDSLDGKSQIYAKFGAQKERSGSLQKKFNSTWNKAS